MSSARRGAVFAFRAAAGEASAVSFECMLERQAVAGGGATAATATATAAEAATNGTTTTAPIVLLGASSLGAWEPCSSPKGFGGLGTGTWVFSVRARDAAGNEQRLSANSSSASWTVRLPRHAKLVRAERAKEGAESGGGGGGGGGGGAAAPSPSPGNATARYSATFSFEADPGDEAAVAAAAGSRVALPPPPSPSPSPTLIPSTSSSSISASASSTDAFECSLSAWNSSTASYSTVVSQLQPCESPTTYSDLPGAGTLYLFQVGIAATAAGGGGSPSSPPASGGGSGGDLAAATQLALGDPSAPADAAALLPSARIDAFPPRVVSAAPSSSSFDVPFSLADGSPAADRFSCSLQGPVDDGSLWSPCVSPYQLDFAAMVDGSYVLRVAAESDAAALAQQAAAEAAAGGGTTTTTFNGRGAPASASFVLDSLAPNVTSIALQARTTLKGGKINSTLLEYVDLTYGAANEVRVLKKKKGLFFFRGRSRFFILKKKLKKKNILSTQADLALLRSLGVMPCAFAFRGRTSSVRFAPSVAGADDGALGSGVAGARCRLVPWSENAAPVLLVPIPVRAREGRGRGIRRWFFLPFLRG